MTIEQVVDQAAYKQYLERLTEEELEQEFADLLGNELGEFGWMMYHYGRDHVEQFLATFWTARE